LQGQKEAACMFPASVATGMLFTGTNAVKIANAVTWSFYNYRLVIIEVSYYAETVIRTSHSNLYSTQFPI